MNVCIFEPLHFKLTFALSIQLLFYSAFALFCDKQGINKDLNIFLRFLIENRQDPKVLDSRPVCYENECTRPPSTGAFDFHAKFLLCHLRIAHVFLIRNLSIRNMRLKFKKHRLAEFQIVLNELFLQVNF